jgi:hypothetical protein
LDRPSGEAARGHDGEGTALGLCWGISRGVMRTRGLADWSR